MTTKIEQDPRICAHEFELRSNKDADNVDVTEEYTNKDASHQHSSEDSDGHSSNDELLLAAGIDPDDDDDSSLPCLTLRMWTISITLTVLVTGLNTLFTLRKPSVTISSAVVQLVAFPIGRAWEKLLPDWTFSVCGRKLRLNPGAFNEKEHILIYIMSNLSYSTRLSADTLTEQEMFFGFKAGVGFQILITLGTILTGFTFAGLARALIVEPKNLVWPGVLANTALNRTLHHKGESGGGSTWQISRYAFFMVVFVASFVWYWFPNFIFPAVGYFTFLCWIWPRSAVVNQLFGMSSGLGIVPLTLDWSQIAYIGSPLVVPTWAILNVGASLLFWIYIITPAMYYSNTWFSAYLPIQSTAVFDDAGKTYNVTKILTHDDKFDHAKYSAYSPIYLPITYALSNFGLQFAAVMALIVWFVLEKHTALRRAPSAFKSWIRAPCKVTKEGTYKDVPVWWYALTGVASLFCLILACEYWPVQLPWYGVLLALAVSSILFIPLAMVYATANAKVSIDALCRLIAGYVFEGKVLANIWFFDIGYVTGIKGLAFAQDLKLGIYCNIPPRDLFLVQTVGIGTSVLTQVGVLRWALNHISNVCQTDAPDGFSCPYSKTHFNTSLIWGALGPKIFFSRDSIYRPLLWFFLIGALLPVPVYLLKRRYPDSLWRYCHVPLFLGGLNYLPPATGTNYGSWVIVGLIFGLLVKKRAFDWWQKYNFVLSAALDSSVAIAGAIIFFTIFYTGAAKGFSWWGTTVYQSKTPLIAMIETKKTKVLLYGLGAIGGFYAFLLSRDPSVELSVVARSNLEAVKKNGMTIHTLNHGSHNVHFDRVLSCPHKIATKYDYIVCAHKAITPGLDPNDFRSVANMDTTFVILQNGVGNEEPFRQSFPYSTIISCVIWVGATQESPGVIRHTASEHTDIGLYPNPEVDPALEDARLEGFVAMLRAGETSYTISDNIQIKRWEKVVWNVAWNPLTTLTRQNTQEWLSSSKESVSVTKRLMREVIGVARRAGVTLEYGLVDVLMERIQSMPGIESSMQVDAREGRRLEVDVILGTPMRMAREFGMDVPTLATVYALTVAVDRMIKQKLSGTN
ncbi:OPT superfamily oligopeptide transporter, partial [Aureobasidium melanogenum]